MVLVLPSFPELLNQVDHRSVLAVIATITAGAHGVTADEKGPMLELRRPFSSFDDAIDLIPEIRSLTTVSFLHSSV